MTAKIIDGKVISSQIKENIKKEVDTLTAKGGRAPGLAVILVGNDPASGVYVKNKTTSCAQVGFYSRKIELPESTTQGELVSLVEELNQDNKIDGILVQLPLPAQLDANAILEKISPEKDVDGFHPYNVGRLAQRMPALRPCTTLAYSFEAKSFRKTIPPIKPVAPNIKATGFAMLVDGSSLC